MFKIKTRRVSKNGRRKCPAGYVKRAGYTRKNTGTRVKSSCIRSTSGHLNAFKAQTQKVKAKMQARLARVLGTRKRCPPGQIARDAYVRKVSHSVAQQGYLKRTKTGKIITVYPKEKSVFVPASCVKDVGKVGKLPEGAPTIGPLRKGELKKHGYAYLLPEMQRRNALRKAIGEFGPLSTYRKLNAASKLTVSENPAASKAFADDRNWIRKTYSKNGALRAF